MRKSDKKYRHLSKNSGTNREDQDETNVLLNQETLDYFDGNEDGSSDNSSNDVSLVIEPGRTRRYHRCFKVNLCLNISMLITFVGLITFGPWYSMSYQNNQV